MLYGKYVTDMPHIKSLFVDAYTRLVAMKLYGLRTADYMRTASPDDRRYLLYNPIMKMKVTTQGEEVINLLWDIIAAKGFEKDTYFSMATRDIRALPKLEGTVHVNIMLIIKFMQNYLFNPKDYPPVDKQNQPKNDSFLFNQGPARGLGKIQFHDYQIAYDSYDLPNLDVFKEQIEVFKEFLMNATLDAKQLEDIDFMLSIGEIFTLIAYGQLILENAKIYDIDTDIIDQIFDFMIRDFSKFALQVYSKPSSRDEQRKYCLDMIKKPVVDEERFNRVLDNYVYSLKDVYEMNK
jgi:acyl-CoA dehydrogenase